MNSQRAIWLDDFWSAAWFVGDIAFSFVIALFTILFWLVALLSTPYPWIFAAIVAVLYCIWGAG